jgi:hypothetical protein
MLWDANIGFPISAPKNLSPTFLSSLTTRRYALRIIIRVVNMHHAAFELQLPLQIVHEPLNEGPRPLCCQSLSAFLGLTGYVHAYGTGILDQDEETITLELKLFAIR